MVVRDSALLRKELLHGLAHAPAAVGPAHVRVARALEEVLYGAVDDLLERDGVASDDGERAQELKAAPVLVGDPVCHAVHGAASRRMIRILYFGI